MVDVQPYHETEIEIQLRTGRRSLAEALAPRIWSEITPEVVEFLPTLSFAVAGSLDEAGQPWASVLCGKPGFLKPTKSVLQINVTPNHYDPLSQNLRDSCDLGVIGIDFVNRRRFRLNGRARSEGNRISLDVAQCYRNCPQYIHAREATFDEQASVSSAVSQRMKHLDADAARIVAQADTFFIATHGCGSSASDFRLGADVSHRGGNPGFVALSADGARLAFPDYIGNFMFNTLGNLSRYPKCGLLFVQFDSGSTLQITGRANVDWELARATAVPGAQRMIDVEISEAVLTRSVLPLSWRLIEPARDLRRYRTPAVAPAATGQVTPGASSPQPQDGFKTVYVSKIVDEADRIRSFYLRPKSGRLSPYLAGQHVRIKLPVAGAPQPVVRHYSLSDYDPSPSEYRVAVRRSSGDPETSGSSWLHHCLQEGDELRISQPEGAFTLAPESERPIALISIGSGVTPVLAMLHSLVRSRTHRHVWFVHGARNGAEHAYAAEVRRLSDRLPNLKAHFRYSRPRDVDFMGRDHDSVGRLDATFLWNMVPHDADFYFCGPVEFMAQLKQALLDRGVARDRVRFEAFGQSHAGTGANLGLEGANVRFEQSDTEATWRGDHGSILELAEAAGLTLIHSCRAGSCGTCEHTLKSGQVFYEVPPLFDVASDKVLVCCSKPLSDVVIGRSTGLALD
jgi:ferredoxin-NADP reductase/predicted pyridoxine 5'-phosphate oxidase superfamily flavin-nucleotide-binding protein